MKASKNHDDIPNLCAQSIPAPPDSSNAEFLLESRWAKVLIDQSFPKAESHVEEYVMEPTVVQCEELLDVVSWGGVTDSTELFSG